jgi:hypothetical protein
MELKSKYSPSWKRNVEAKDVDETRFKIKIDTMKGIGLTTI